MENHHMIPSYGTYFADLLPSRDDPYFQVSLTVEGHASQHDVLFRVFGNSKDKRVQSLILHSSDKAEAGRKGGKAGRGKPKPKKAPPTHGRRPFSPIYGEDPNTGEKFLFAGPTVAAKHMNGNPSAISAVAKGSRSQHKGWKFWRVTDNEG